MQLFQFTPYIAIEIAFLGSLTLVMELLSSTEGDLDLHQIAPEIDRGGDEGEALLLHLAPQAFDFLLMGQEAAGALYLVVMNVAVRIRLDVQRHERQRVPLDGHIGVGEAEAPLAYALHLGTDECDAALKVFDDLVVEVRLFVLLQQLVVRFVVFHLFIPGDAYADLVAAGLGRHRPDTLGGNGGAVAEITAPLHDGRRCEGEGGMEILRFIVIKEPGQGNERSVGDLPYPAEEHRWGSG